MTKFSSETVQYSMKNTSNSSTNFSTKSATSLYKKTILIIRTESASKIQDEIITFILNFILNINLNINIKCLSVVVYENQLTL